jgi:hypothetical protein
MPENFPIGFRKGVMMQRILALIPIDAVWTW